ncbi:hypothetical protein CS542_09375 [Pedobacter sp. IW39]|nr:hypothetical protein CS542_09375 [Pedobacter sp. IW39]
MAVIVSRNSNGEVRPSYGRNGIQYRSKSCRIFNLPSTYPEHVQERVETIAKHCRSFKYNSLAVEMFITKDGQILVNELAPRPQ